uniref:Protein kinase domain-containing protein n=1 Tax=Panagrolaimus sp. JU765 TaxID=591449 RepID=A0AC34QTS6_9BILA
MKDGRRPDVAVKLAKNTAMTKEKIKEMMREARLMRNFSYHPNIVQLYGVAVEREPLMIVMELVNGGALDEYLKNHKECTTSERLDNMVCGAAFGLEYLHSVPVLHRDIAARNCLYSNGVCKISDFGLSREGEKYVLQVVRKCPIKWLAPEVIQTLTYTQKTDIWSFGIFAWEVFAGSEPYPGMNNAEVKERVTNGYKMEFPCETPPDLVQLITDICWAMEPDKRSTMKELVVRLCAISGVVPPVVTQSNMSNIASGQDIIPGQEDKEKERKHKKKGHKKSKKEQREKERDKDRGKEREKDKEKDDDYVSESSRVVKKHKKRKI